MKIQVIGFCDVRDKPYGETTITLFREADKFLADEPPSMADLQLYAEFRGYYPSGHRGAQSGICDPVYRILDPSGLYKLGKFEQGERMHKSQPPLKIPKKAA